MTHHLVLGAGGVGRATTAELVSLGHTVTLVSRSGRVTDRPWETIHPDSVEVAAADARDGSRLAALARGATSIINALNPPSYTTWETDWPPVAAAILSAAEVSGAGLVMIGNLYGYGRVDVPMSEGHPMRPAGHKGRLRARMWAEALALHDAGRIRATEVRSSDYFGPGTTRMTSYLNDVIIDSLLAGRPPFVPLGRRDAPHSWTYVPDVGRLAARVATGDEGWGRVWHVPTSAPRSFDEAADDVARIAGVRRRRLWVLPRALGTAAGVAVPFMRELRETRHQFERPFILDSVLTERTFGLEPTPWEDALKITIESRRHSAAYE
ncbi:MAG TPA: NAD-dependent epimerase/dehydratase family protein [Intrasporangium sp.]|uniref:NAD-dependent epimerase/dehydratase family protein n=1 Tax=Intrasporangium sp. TaxID=1925024 RepID=UPI002B494462|nr:NAD-dependent epimerase/dehydratase family protein [Intrasporangium sp.]HKX68488.1 NAD-dependent epimerase/dehydratase family protein [Intrasporangium sp.]